MLKRKILGRDVVLIYSGNDVSKDEVRYWVTVRSSDDVVAGELSDWLMAADPTM